MTTLRTYSAFGLTIASEFTLDASEALTISPSAVDVHFRRAERIIRCADYSVDPWFEISPAKQYMFWRAIGAFLIEDPSTVLVETHPGTSDHLAAQALLGIVISIVLERRQLLCLHAGAVATGNGAAVLMGDKGAGKSTTVAAMMNLGLPPVTDDLVAVKIDHDATPAPMIRPGLSSLKLWPDSIAALALPRAQSDRLIHPQVTKVQKRMPLKIVGGNTPFGAGFVLDRSHKARGPVALRLAPHEALQNVLRFSFMARYGETTLGRDHLVAHIKRCGALVARVPFYRLIYPADMTRLRDLGEVIERTTLDRP